MLAHQYRKKKNHIKKPRIHGIPVQSKKLTQLVKEESHESINRTHKLTTVNSTAIVQERRKNARDENKQWVDIAITA